ncbi:hypothetical protein B194_4261 [Serratia plymuthica A30]|nr:hypothetical protein B194_4261 [Serratia plymuthica A30]
MNKLGTTFLHGKTSFAYLYDIFVFLFFYCLDGKREIVCIYLRKGLMG